MTHAGFWSFAAASPEALAVVDPDGTEWSAGPLLRDSQRIVHGPRALGLGRGDCVAVASPNRAEVLATFMAATQAGMYLVPINWHLTAAEIAYVLQDSNAKAFIASDRIGSVCRDAANLANVPVSGRFALGLIEGFQSFSDWCASQP